MSTDARLMYVFVHDLCSMPAFLYKELPGPGDVIRSALGITLDGKKPHGRVVCGSCGQHIILHDSRVPRDHLKSISDLTPEQMKKIPKEYRA